MVAEEEGTFLCLHPYMPCHAKPFLGLGFERIVDKKWLLCFFEVFQPSGPTSIVNMAWQASNLDFKVKILFIVCFCMPWLYKLGTSNKSDLYPTLRRFCIPLNPPRYKTFLTMDIFNESSYFDIFLHVDVLEIFNFDYTKIKTTILCLVYMELTMEKINHWILDYDNFK